MSAASLEERLRVGGGIGTVTAASLTRFAKLLGRAIITLLEDIGSAGQVEAVGH